MHKKLLVILLGIVFVLTACGSTDDTSESNEGETTTANAGGAAEIYKNKCSSCHGENLKGGFGPDLTTVGTKYSQEEIQTIIVDGTGRMPSGLIKSEDAEKVAKWLKEYK